MAGPILFLHPSDEAYGADRILLELVDAAMAEGRPVGVLLADDLPPGWLSRQLESRGLRVSRVPLAPARRRYLRLAGLPGYAIALVRARGVIRREATQLGATIIHANTVALLAAGIVGRPGGARLVWHVHEIVGRSPLEWILFRLLPLVAASRVIAVSGAVARTLAPQWLARRRAVVVHNGLPDRQPMPAPARSSVPPLFAYVGRLNRWKGYDQFVSAAGELVAAGVPAGFAIAGDAPSGETWRRNDLTRRVEAAGIGGVTSILGQREDGEAVIEAADVVVVPSTLPDPLPTVVLEAMRAGRPVVAASHGGIPEMILQGQTGLLVPPRDTAALADAMRRLAQDSPLRARLGQAGRARFIEAFSLDLFRSAISRVWASVE